MHCLLIVHPDPSVRTLMSSMLQSTGHKIEEASTDRAAVRMMGQAAISVVLAGADDDMSDALELIGYVRRKHPDTPVILFSSCPRPEQLREAAQRGAATFLKFPLPATQLRAAVAQALPEMPAFVTSSAFEAAGTHKNGNSTHHAELTSGGFHAPIERLSASMYGAHVNGNGTPVVSLGEPIGDDPTMRQVFDLTEAIAPRRSPVLILGECGTGKKMLVKLLHHKSPRRDGPLLIHSCQSQKEGELESELLGRWSGGSVPEHPGLFSRAAGGTLYLEEVQTLSPALQSLVLRAIRDGEYRPVGSDRGLRLDCRLILGCSEELGPLVDRGEFRSDLFYALSAVTINLPPLRHRGQDVMRLAEHFRELFSHQQGKSVVGISPDAGRRLASHDWPSNVAELMRVIEHAVRRCRGHWIEPNHLDLEPTAASNGRGEPSSVAGSRQPIIPLKEALEEPEKKLILEALRALNWNRQETARMLDINRTTLYKKMKKYGLIFEEPVWAN